MIKIRRALISCWDKTGLEDLAGCLHRMGVEMISSGGTATYLADHGIPVTSVDQITGFPAVLDGRVKTLHPAIHAGILARRTPAHLEDLRKIGGRPIDLVVVNLYPFVKEAAEKQLPAEQAIELIDIGGPAMLRAAAKNYEYVTALFDPGQYHEFTEHLQKNDGQVTAEYARRRAREVFFYTTWYDGQIQRYLGRGLETDPILPDFVTVTLQKIQPLRYGENPHQTAAVYRPFGEPAQGLAGAEVLWGKPLSFNNYADIHAAYALALDLPQIACAIIKHTNPCGAAVSDASLSDAFSRALRGDPVSAFGGIVACNHPVDAAAAEQMRSVFFECIIAPDFAGEALEILTRKKNLRLLKMDPQRFEGDGRDYKFLNNTVLLQEADHKAEDPQTWRVVTRKKPDNALRKELAFAWQICKHVKSNAIVLTRDREVYGVGAGQMSRIDSVRIAREKAQNAGRKLSGLVLASDAFFPFRDGIDEAAKAGVSAVIQPGGSVRDEEVIAAANEHQISMVFTGVRHFKH